SLPARIARVEDEAGAAGAASSASAIVYADPRSGRVLVSATGALESVIMLAREAGNDEPALVVGAHVAHHEIVASGDRADDAPARVQDPLQDPERRPSNAGRARLHAVGRHGEGAPNARAAAPVARERTAAS